jgi:hypothetical protein
MTGVYLELQIIAQIDIGLQPSCNGTPVCFRLST